MTWQSRGEAFPAAAVLADPGKGNLLAAWLGFRGACHATDTKLSTNKQKPFPWKPKERARKSSGEDYSQRIEHTLPSIGWCDSEP